MILRNGLFTNQLGGGSFEGARVVKADGGKWVPEFPKEVGGRVENVRVLCCGVKREPARMSHQVTALKLIHQATSRGDPECYREQTKKPVCGSALMLWVE